MLNCERDSGCRRANSQPTLHNLLNPNQPRFVGLSEKAGDSS